MKPNPETFELPEGHTLRVRAPTPETDVDALVHFFTGLPPEERNYLRCDVTRPDTCLERLRQLDGKDHFRLVAELDGRLVADGTLDREPFFWSRHVAAVRCVIAPEVRPEVGKRLLHELVALGHQAHIELLYSEVMPEQTEHIAMLVETGFVYEATRHRFAKDVRGTYHDVHIMSNDLERVWQRLEQQLEDMDMRDLSGHA
ncbi:MAG TPA: hypothetical protein PK668_11040 [Myxococcota bacterium]|nr:hypothetical protein [Myxococcota bacterium]HRY93300.1 hypothetical protein [Myxococcota bacterium]HSA20390.1 hypothetical protein [Myxococcota bacterium]